MAGEVTEVDMVFRSRTKCRIEVSIRAATRDGLVWRSSLRAFRHELSFRFRVSYRQGALRDRQLGSSHQAGADHDVRNSRILDAVAQADITGELDSPDENRRPLDKPACLAHSDTRRQIDPDLALQHTRTRFLG